MPSGRKNAITTKLCDLQKFYRILLLKLEEELSAATTSSAEEQKLAKIAVVQEQFDVIETTIAHATNISISELEKRYTTAVHFLIRAKRRGMHAIGIRIICSLGSGYGAQRDLSEGGADYIL